MPPKATPAAPESPGRKPMLAPLVPPASCRGPGGAQGRRAWSRATAERAVPMPTSPLMGRPSSCQRGRRPAWRTRPKRCHSSAASCRGLAGPSPSRSNPQLTARRCSGTPLASTCCRRPAKAWARPMRVWSSTASGRSSANRVGSSAAAIWVWCSSIRPRGQAGTASATAITTVGLHPALGADRQSRTDPLTRPGAIRRTEGGIKAGLAEMGVIAITQAHHQPRELEAANLTGALGTLAGGSWDLRPGTAPASQLCASAQAMPRRAAATAAGSAARSMQSTPARL
jgi:hypothetical protein